MALFRALESARPTHQRLFADLFARAFLRPRLRLVVALARVLSLDGTCRVIDRRWPGARSSAVARTRFIDDRLQVMLASAMEQLVLLGAGFDSRPYRLSACEPIAVFEVDHPDTLAKKRRVLETQLGTLPRHVRFVATDFNQEALPARMAAAGFDATRRTLVVWEGVTNYLSEAAVDETLGWCAQLAPGSQLLFTYVHRGRPRRPAILRGDDTPPCHPRSCR